MAYTAGRNLPFLSLHEIGPAWNINCLRNPIRPLLAGGFLLRLEPKDNMQTVSHAVLLNSTGRG